VTPPKAGPDGGRGAAGGLGEGSSDVFAAIERQVVAIGELLEQTRRYRPLAAETAGLYGSVSRVTALVRRANRGTRVAGLDLGALARAVESSAGAVRRLLDEFHASPTYRALLEALERGDVEASRQLVGAVFADLEPATPVGELYVPLTAKRGEGLLDPEAAAEAVDRMAQGGIEPQAGPGVGADANVRPIRLYDGVVGVDVAVWVIVAGEDVRAPAFRAPELGEVLVYARRLQAPLSVGLRRDSPDDWIEMRAGGYPTYRESCRERIRARGVAVRDL
jgi:hypothetical protein